jgi:hypothetical protein
LKPRLKAALALAAMFGLGGATGFAGGRIAVLSELRRLYDGPPLALRQRLTVAALERHVALSDEQKRQVESVIERHDPALRRLRADMAPRTAEMRASLLADLEAIMTAEQRGGWSRFRAYVEERARAQGE